MDVITDPCWDVTFVTGLDRADLALYLCIAKKWSHKISFYVYVIIAMFSPDLG